MWKHTEGLLTEMFGLSQEEYRSLKEDGVLEQQATRHGRPQRIS